MSYWWQDRPEERFWVEIRHIPGIGLYLECPDRDEAGKTNAWYELVRSVVPGDIIYHWSVREGRFVGRSTVDRAPEHRTKSHQYYVKLTDFSSLAVEVDRERVRDHASRIYQIRDELMSEHKQRLYLPFQFKQDSSKLAFMSNYFAKLPRSVVQQLFGEEEISRFPDDRVHSQIDPNQGSRKPPFGFLLPFKPKADNDYSTRIVGTEQQRTRSHETLVNLCANWLACRGLQPARNNAIDLGLLDGSVIIEAKAIKAEAWAHAIREAIGQLYEYRYFRVANPAATLVILVDRPMPGRWTSYLEADRGIGAMWPAGEEFHMTPTAKAALG